jgi:formyltetrahydrofolate-dependent phosphoribosylglycinamide formyltransferase
MTARVAVLASGQGTNLQALIDYLADLGEHAAAQVVVVASNRSDAFALTRARDASIASEVFSAKDDGEELLDLLKRHSVNLVVLAGYLKKVPGSVVRAFRGRIVNVHPGLLPEFGGAGMYGIKVHEAVLAAGAKVSGVSVHLVDDEFDRGPLIAQWPVPVLDGDTPESLAARVLKAEHVIFPRAVEMIASLNEKDFFADF